eukprot:CAMPEP_0116999642 /NCGR_PEP_ID=MMETSP0472-20121206/2280_1 /TAXON_ID=693140 ORGANISM="Tiarina fusus, Strain LIS" /NCGR_SAMPLE_ID=MMETSP0472 /ASSEMBLY_ACC=CAM_ASM_000603 /LENGTH=180 /DNA_ID=CAMNT_0004699131 /DNA_START=193 /DNA_END=731 /DNA_ORIENTATION=-
MRVLILLLCFLSSGSAFFLTVPGLKTRAQLKSELLDLATETKRGLEASAEQQDKILELFEQLEKLNPTKKTLKSDLVNGVWDLQYTTSESILGKGGFPRVGPILQTINTRELAAENYEVVNYFGVKVPRRVTAALTPKTDQYTDVQFKRFQIGPVGFNAPEKFKGALDITYLDDSMRLTR